MDDAYRRLAAALDALPHGFPATESGVELRILEHIFAPDEAELAAAMLPVPERVEAIARRTGRPVEALRGQLEEMAAKGQVLAVPRPGGMRYALVPFVIGIYEFQLPRMDRELAELVEEYFPALMKSLGGHRPGMARVVPVGVHIDAPPAVLPYESVRSILDDGGSFRVMPCICRKEQATLGSPCSHTPETCLAISPDPAGLQDFPACGRRIEREEALALLDRFEQEGLVHCTYNVRTGPMFICNCCPCCCGFLRGITEFEAPNFLIRSNWVAEVEAGECLACGTCVERCPTGAIVARDDAVAVTDERCIGCGVCVVTCAGGALRLAARPEAERTTPPQTVAGWALQRAAARKGWLRAAAQFGGIAAKAVWSELSARPRGSRTGAPPP
ncbi:MAG: 4Fe-4S binding protein [Acidobacteria bacterium]|jgi:Fe-S-cluster-containing hydrogenase component 2|nr:4Fe-4S binding protein [Acidobacteriota bacterium]